MFLTHPLPFVKEFVAEVNNALEQHQPGSRALQASKPLDLVLPDGNSDDQRGVLGPI